MKFSNSFFKGVVTSFIISLSITTNAQECITWNDLPNKEDLVKSHVIYRSFMKEGKLDEAFSHWETVYKAAPMADGQRAFHYSDGREIYMNKFKNTNDPALKKEYSDKVLELYDQEINCFKQVSFVSGRKAYDMFYTFRSPAEDIYKNLKRSLDEGGNAAEYIIFTPLGYVMTTLFKEGKLPAEEIVAVVDKVASITEHNLANNKQYGQYYEESRVGMVAGLRPIEADIFDCDYFKKNLLPTFDVANDTLERVRYIYSTLISKGGCDKEDPELSALVARFSELTEIENARILAEHEANNPMSAAKRLTDEGKFNEALQKIEEALNEDVDADTKAQIYYYKAFVLGRKLNQYSASRTAALKAAESKPNWGAPYIFIGDLYVLSSRSCSDDDIKQRIVIIAAIDKYTQAKNIDAESAAEAQKKINTYNASLPEKGEAFMQGYTEGQRVNTGCWVGETVTLRFK